MIVRAAVFMLALGAPATVRAEAAEAPAAIRAEHTQLHIGERRIEASSFQSDLEVGIDRPLAVRVGTAVTISHVVLELRGVRGDLTFHGDLSALTRSIAQHVVRSAGTKENR